MTTTTFSVSGIDPADADRLRAAGGIAYVADEKPGFPCRQCLRDAEIGEEMILVSYDPFEQASPYRSASPIFLHRSSCTNTFDHVDELPQQLTCRNLSVRGFDRAAMMQDGVVIDGRDLQATINDLFANPAIAYLHVHNAGRGCWAAKVRRSE
jgi:hypothetical protein